MGRAGGGGGAKSMTPERTGIWGLGLSSLVSCLCSCSCLYYLFRRRYGKHCVKSKAASIEISLSPPLLTCASFVFSSIFYLHLLVFSVAL